MDGTFVIALAGEMPGVEFAPGWIGLVDRPGGIFAGSMFTKTFEFAVFAFVLSVTPPPQPAATAPRKTIAANKILLLIYKLHCLNIAVPA